MNSLFEAAAALREGAVSCVEFTKAALDSAARVQPQLNAYLAMMDEQALAQAKQLDEEGARGKWRSALHGIPVALKDVYCTKGVKTTCGSPLFAGHVPSYDSAVAEKLAAAGAVCIGKTHMHELAYGVTSNNPHYGPVRNPWNVSHVPGGSSGGSGATVAARSVFMAMGSDTGGSIRIPAAFCGTVGLKPTTGRVSRYGVMPLDFTLDHMGPLTRTVRDAAAVLQVLAGFDERDDSSSRAPVGSYTPVRVGIQGLRIGIPETFYYERLHPDVAAAMEALGKLADSLGAVRVAVKVPDIAEINATARIVLLSEASAALGPYLADRSKFGADVLALFDQGRLLAATDYVNAQRLRRIQQREFNRVFEQCDIVLTPAAPVPAPRVGQTEVDLGGGQMEDTRLAATRFARAINLLGLPALALPCGMSNGGLPVGAQLIGRAFDEATLLWAGAALEDGMPWRDSTPPVM
ncbi:MAG: amidase [Bryobacterales bacterium]|nr:amidase [Bryobacterales bacterium]